jgi:hypothetical protein
VILAENLVRVKRAWDSPGNRSGDWVVYALGSVSFGAAPILGGSPESENGSAGYENPALPPGPEGQITCSSTRRTSST